MLKIMVNGSEYDIELKSEDEVVEDARLIVVRPCYVPGNFPWDAQ